MVAMLYIAGLYAAFIAGVAYLRIAQPAGVGSLRLPLATLILLLVVGVPSLLQLGYPALLTTLQRNAPMVFGGQWWRVVTSLVVQDGGIAGTVFNLVSLAFVGVIAEQILGSAAVVVLFFGGGIIAELVALFWQPIGGGNSVANFSIAAGIAVTCLLRRPVWQVMLAAWVALGADLILLSLRDIHGVGALGGAILALLFRNRWKHERSGGL